MPLRAAGEQDVEERMLLDITIDPGDGSAMQHLTLNEAVVERSAEANTIRLRVEIDGDFFTTYAVDGMIVATPTGSTYTFQLGVRSSTRPPEQLLTPVSPHAFRSVLSAATDDSVSLAVDGHHPTVSVDGRRIFTVGDGAIIRCSAATQSANIITFGSRRFYHVLRRNSDSMTAENLHHRDQLRGCRVERAPGSRLGRLDELSLVSARHDRSDWQTEAGKTLIVGAIDLLTGGRAARRWSAPGPTRQRSRAVSSSVMTRSWSGVIPADGRSRVYLNGHLDGDALTDVGVDLIDLHGKHAHQSLLKTPVQRGALDQYGRIDTAPLASLLDELRAPGCLTELGGDERARAREILLRFQVEEIEAAGIIDPDEDRRLDDEGVCWPMPPPTERLPRRSHCSTPMVLRSSRCRLHGGPRRSQSVLRPLEPPQESPPSSPTSRPRRARSGSKTTHRPGGLRGGGLCYANCAASTARAFTTSWHQLIRRTVGRARRLRRARRGAGSATVGLLADLTRLRAEVLSARTEAAPRMAEAVQTHLAGLAMAGARLEISVTGEAGDEVVFRLAANAGHDPQPLSRVASGGELARTMLALRLVLTAGPPTLVFDEVDAGIGGDVANTVGASLADLARTHQVLVVTHLAQVAAFADQHVAIAKHEASGQTVSEATVLGEDARITELSRMLSGSPDSASARDHAAELIAGAAHLRSS